MTSETKPGDKPGDPADRAADGAFGGVTPHATHSHRAGYGDDKLERLIDYLHRHPRATLASGEGLVLVAHIGLLRADLTEARAEIDRLTRILAALREPSKEVWGAALEAYNHALFATHTPRLISALRAAVAAAEQEVDHA